MELSGGEVVAAGGEGVEMEADDMCALVADVEHVRGRRGENPS